MGGWVVGTGSGVVDSESCLKIKEEIYIFSSVLCANLQLPAHQLISPNSFYEALNKGKLSPINYCINIFPSGLANNFGKL